MSSERLSEQIDQAQEMQRENEARALANVRANLAPETHPDFDGKHCVDCTGLIPKARLLMEKVRCVVCQDILERGSKLFRR